MTWAAVAISIIGAGVSAYGQYEQGQSQKKAANYNAEMDRRAADDALQRGAIDAARIKENTRKLISTQIANSGASGFDSSTGTALDLSVEAKGYGELDALTTINNAQRQASGLEAQSVLDRYQGKASGRAGTMGAAGTLISGAGSAASSYYGIKKGALSGANSGKTYKPNGEFI